MKTREILSWAALILLLTPGFALAEVPWTQESEQIIGVQWGQWAQMGLQIATIIAIAIFTSPRK